jgi:uncharacterized protein
MSRSEEIGRLKAELAEALVLDPQVLVGELKDAGFSCKRCAGCCRAAGGDNIVAVFPGEVRDIMAASGRRWFEVVQPPESNDFDAQGRRHAFEWVLRRKPDGDCIFLDGGRCTVYAVRPHICRTYPFRLDAGKVEQYECERLSSGGDDDGDLLILAGALVTRRIDELREAIELLKRYDPFEPGEYSARGVIVVHDSEGTKYILRSIDGQYSFDQHPE